MDAIRRRTLWDIQRDRWSFLASYYAWSARKGWPMGNDPLTGSPWPAHDANARRLGRAAYLALAREAFAIARAYGPLPLP